MNKYHKLRNGFTLVLLLTLTGLLTGCIHTSQRSVEFRGRMLDAETHLPIKGAKIYFAEPPQHSTYTDAYGRFRMKARTQFHWGGNPAGGDWPPAKSSDWKVSHPDYFPVLEYERDRRMGDIGDVLLKPRK